VFILAHQPRQRLEVVGGSQPETELTSPRRPQLDGCGSGLGYPSRSRPGTDAAPGGPRNPASEPGRWMGNTDGARRETSDGPALQDRSEPCSRRDELADAEGDRPEGGTRNHADGCRGAASSSLAEPESEQVGSARLPWPPPPGDLAGWEAALAGDPTLEPAVRGVAHGIPNRMDRLRTLGNGVVPLAAAHALRTLAARMSAWQP
jgi:DNA (cytosine-5)-methyltransferase 1